MTFPLNPNDFIIINYCHYRSKIPGKVESQSYHSSQLPGIFRLLYPGRKKKWFSNYCWETVIINIEKLKESLKILLPDLKNRIINSISLKKCYDNLVCSNHTLKLSMCWAHTSDNVVQLWTKSCWVNNKHDPHCQWFANLYSITNSIYANLNLHSPI